ncbi:hypothetical protein L611_002000000320 [Aminobacter sp. J15]|nr:hypothetical protein L611_002000000320 [Aminobacter sp. J15]
MYVGNVFPHLTQGKELLCGWPRFREEVQRLLSILEGPVNQPFLSLKGPIQS